MGPSTCILLIAISLSGAWANDNLTVAYQWKILDFEYPSPEARQEAIDSKEFIPENNLPLGLEVYDDRLFVTVPRWKTGVAASLTYINLTDKSTDSPKLRPYPNWEAHKLRLNDTPGIVSPFRVRADRCQRLWVMDTGVANLLSENGPHVYAPNRLLVFDLRNDNLLRSYVIPKDQQKAASFFANIAVEDHDCGNTHAYLGDLGSAAIVVYSWRDNSSWRVTHNFFHIDPDSGVFNVSGILFEWSDAVFGLALSSPDSEGYSTLYFHPLTSTYEFSVSTKVLRDQELATSKRGYHQFKVLGSRGPKSQSTVSFLDKKTDVLFYALVNLNAVACWRTTNPNYTMESQGRVFMSNVSMVFPNDIKVDNNDNLWVLSDRLPTFMYDKLDYDDVNFRILTASVPDAIRNTACDSKLVVKPEIKNTIMGITNLNIGNVNISVRNNDKTGSPSSATFVEVVPLSTVLVVAILRFV